VNVLQTTGTITVTASNPPRGRNLKEDLTPVRARAVLERTLVELKGRLAERVRTRPQPEVGR
jgi:hypothetical protein